MEDYENDINEENMLESERAWNDYFDLLEWAKPATED